jgi:zinc/manganese transport system permease protein
VLGAATGLTALFLYLDTTATATTGATQQVLFGSIFTISSSLVVVVTFSVLAVAVIAVIWRPLLLATVSPDIAAARGVPVRLIGMAYMLALAVAVSLSSLTVGAILSTALLIGPAATALHLTSRMGRALVLACLISVVATWAGILLAYDSYYWGSDRQGLPVSFFIVAVVFAVYLLFGLPARRTAAGARGNSTSAASDATGDQVAA